MSVRWQLTLWYASLFGAILVVFAVSTYAFVHASLTAPLIARAHQDFATIEATLRNTPDEIVELEAHRVVGAFRIMEDGQTVHESGEFAAAYLGETAAPLAPFPWYGLAPDRRHYYIQRDRIQIGDRPYEIAVGVDAEAAHTSLRRLAWGLGVGLPLALALAGLAGYWLAGRVLSPLRFIAAKTGEITAERLAQRLPIDNPRNEFGHLAGVFNATLSRLQDGFERLRRFTADAAHELRTPLAVIRSVGEAGLQTAQAPDRYRDVIGSMLEETDRLTRLVDGLLTLARADGGRVPIERKPVDLATLCREATECLRVLAEEKRQDLVFANAGAPAAAVDAGVLRQALINIIANAIRFTPVGGHINVSLARQADHAAIAVTDNGPGIAREHQARLFERFYRVDRSRSHETGGTGLGLAIARWAVEANGGRIELDSELGRGSCFRIILPCPAAGGV